MNDETRPWVDGVEIKTFYVLVIDERPDNYIMSEFLDLINYSYTTNEWKFNSFLRFLKPVVDNPGVEWHIKTYNDCTWERFKEYMKEVARVDIVENHSIENADVEWLDLHFFTNGVIETDIENIRDEYDFVTEECFHYLFGTRYFLKNHYPGEKPRAILDVIAVLDRLCNVYIPLMMLTERKSGDANWFNKLPDKFKIMMTKLADFPTPLEELEYYDLDALDYSTWIYLVQWLNYPGIIPGSGQDSRYYQEVGPPDG